MNDTVPADGCFRRATGAGTAVLQCAWPNPEDGATADRTASVPWAPCRHIHTAELRQSRLPLRT